MIRFATDGLTFQLRAAALLVNRDRLLLHRLRGDDFWTLPGGRVEAGEDGETALRRELREELGETVGAMRLAHLVEGFFPTEADGPYHELAMHFLAPIGDDSRLAAHSAPFAGIEAGKPLEFAWFDLDALDGLNLFPMFLRRGREVIAGEGVLHVVERAG